MFGYVTGSRDPVVRKSGIGDAIFSVVVSVVFLFATCLMLYLSLFYYTPADSTQTSHQNSTEVKHVE